MLDQHIWAVFRWSCIITCKILFCVAKLH